MTDTTDNATATEDPGPPIGLIIEQQIENYDLDAKVREVEREIEELDADRRAEAIERDMESEVATLRRLIRG